MKGPYAGHDVDTARMAEVAEDLGAESTLGPEFAGRIRDLADDIEEGGVLVMREMDYTDVRPEDAVRFGLGLEFECLIGSRTLGNLAQHLQEKE